MIIALIAGIVLRATTGWFPQQHEVGDILIWFGAITTVLPFLVVGGFAMLLAWLKG
jgi:hypothetical protein